MSRPGIVLPPRSLDEEHLEVDASAHDQRYGGLQGLVGVWIEIVRVRRIC
jgi:hypothetical protein